MPLPPPCSSTSWPGDRCAVIIRFDQTVHATSGSAAALVQRDALGGGHHLPGGNGDFFGVTTA